MGGGGAEVPQPTPGASQGWYFGEVFGKSLWVGGND